jgi:aldose sugar dehydrogenase
MRTLSTRRHATWILIALAVAVAAANGIARQTPPPARPQAAAPVVSGPPFPSVPALPFPDGSQIFDTLGPSIRVSPLVKGLANPWSLAFLPDGNMLVTEKTGRLRLVRNGILVPQPIAGVPAVFAGGQAGLMDIALHPRFADNSLIYLTYSKPGERGATTALARARFDGTELSQVRDIFVADNWSLGSDHFGSRIAFGRDGMLYMTIGERNDRKRAQDLTIHGGKVLRLKDDGTAPADNPFAGRNGVRQEIYSYGHRNLQGLAFHPTTGVLWETEHGPQGGDELNMILPGKNYGWPIVTLGREYTGEVISAQPAREGIEQPVMFWAPSIGLSGLTIYMGDRFPTWKGNMFMGGLSGLQLQRVAFTDRGPVGRETLLGSLRLRIRDVRQGPDGNLYLAVDSNPGGILRVEPAPGTRSSAGR